MAEFDKEAAKNASNFAHDGFGNATLKRLFKKIVNIGFAATNDSEQLKAVSKNTLSCLKKILFCLHYVDWLIDWMIDRSNS